LLKGKFDLLFHVIQIQNILSALLTNLIRVAIYYIYFFMSDCCSALSFSCFRKFILAPLCICSLYWKDTFLNVKRILMKNFARTYLHSLVHAKVSRKTNIFVSYVKKTNKCFVKSLILAPNFIFLHTPYKNSFFHETTLWACRMSRSTCGFCFGFFWHFETRLKCVQNKGSVCTWEPKHPLFFCFNFLVIPCHVLMGISIAWQVFNIFICLKYNADHVLLSCLHGVVLSKSIKFELFERHECTIDVFVH
jgi:hypothetical protein